MCVTLSPHASFLFVFLPVQFVPWLFGYRSLCTFVCVCVRLLCCATTSTTPPTTTSTVLSIVLARSTTSTFESLFSFSKRSRLCRHYPPKRAGGENKGKATNQVRQSDYPTLTRDPFKFRLGGKELDCAAQGQSTTAVRTAVPSRHGHPCPSEPQSPSISLPLFARGASRFTTTLRLCTDRTKPSFIHPSIQSL